MDIKKSPCGLLVRIEKDALGHRHSQADYVIGYFDRLSIQPIQTWLQFMPNALSSCSNVEEAQPVSVFPIKLLFPSQEMVTYLQKLGLDYESWADGDYSFFDQYPCITVTLINLTDLFKGSIPRDVLGEQLKRFAEIVVQGDFYLDGEKRKISHDYFKDAHFCILPSLGYSDYCLLFAEKSWSLAPAMLDYLHRAFDDGTPVLSTDYTMPVFHAGVRKKVDESNALAEHRDNQMSMSIRVSLRPGASKEKLKAELESVADVFHITGSGDCLIIPHGTEQLGEVLRLLMPNHECGNEVLKDIAMDTETLLRWPVWQDATENEHPPSETNDSTNEKRCFSGSGLVQEEIQKLRNVLKEYETLLHSTNIQLRNVRSMHEHIASLENICSSEHNASLQAIMARWLPAYCFCLQNCVNELTITEKQGHETQMWERVERAIALFNEQAGSFMADLSRSDNFFMESERYNHTSVSSATSLIIAYNRWQNLFAESVMKHAGIGDSKYVFLVKSGGCDMTETIKPFWFLPADEKNGFIVEHVPFITQMSEIGLFDCSGTIFRMTHECMHFCGDRKRKKRLEYMIRFVARYYGWMIAYTTFAKGASAKVINYLSSCYGITEEKMTERLIQANDECTRVFAGRITKLIEDVLNEKKRKLTTEISLMSDHLKDWLLKELGELFIGYSIDKKHGVGASKIVNVLVQEQLEITHLFYDLCDKILQEQTETRFIRLCRLESKACERKLDKLQNGYKPVEVDAYLTQWIALMISHLSIQVPEYCPKSSFQFINQVCVGNIIPDIVINCFSEAYADLEACMRLDASISDYILAFFFECQDVEMVLPETDDLALRLVSVLKVWYDEYLEDGHLTQEAKRELEESWMSWKTHGFVGDTVSVKALIDRINAYIQTYEEMIGEIVKPLEDYLMVCRDDYMSNPEDQLEMQKYQFAFQSIRIMADRTDADAICNMITAMTGVRGGTEQDA